MCVCVCARVRVRVYVVSGVYIYVYRMCVSVCARACVCMHVCVRVRDYVRACVCVCPSIRTFESAALSSVATPGWSGFSLRQASIRPLAQVQSTVREVTAQGLQPLLHHHQLLVRC